MVRQDHWQHLGFKQGSDTALTGSANVDNIYSCSGSAAGATAILEAFALHLGKRWGQEIKPSSRMVMTCRGASEAPPVSTEWQKVTVFPCLGHLIQDDAGIRPCFADTKTKMWKAFWGNCGSRTMRNASVELKCALLSRACRSGLSYRCSRWPPQPTIAKELDRVQSRMVAAILRSPRLSGEAADVYCRRRNQIAAAHCRVLGRWSQHWFARAVAWDDHLQRGHHPHSWSVRLRNFHAEAWLLERRLGQHWQGTATRIARGKPCTRWHDGIDYARSS